MDLNPNCTSRTTSEKDFIRFLFLEKSRFLKLTSGVFQLIIGRTALSQEYFLFNYHLIKSLS
uniref:Uncharacterized protein n=1 Tax=Lepeophtheirus salmonis TaxID=72036 RepID=A0A0K2T0Z7_LEPSM